jgi:hypothetical protein
MPRCGTTGTRKGWPSRGSGAAEPHFHTKTARPDGPKSRENGLHPQCHDLAQHEAPEAGHCAHRTLDRRSFLAGGPWTAYRAPHGSLCVGPRVAAPPQRRECPTDPPECLRISWASTRHTATGSTSPECSEAQLSAIEAHDPMIARPARKWAESPHLRGSQGPVAPAFIGVDNARLVWLANSSVTTPRATPYSSIALVLPRRPRRCAVVSVGLPVSIESSVAL